MIAGTDQMFDPEALGELIAGWIIDHVAHEVPLAVESATAPLLQRIATGEIARSEEIDELTRRIADLEDQATRP